MNTSLDSIVQEVTRLCQEGHITLKEDVVGARALAEQATQLLPTACDSPPLLLAQARILMLLSRCDRKEEQYTSAIARVSEAIQLLEQTDEIEERALAMLFLGGDYTKADGYHIALDTLLPALELAQQTQNHELIGEIQNCIGNTHWFLGNHEKALEAMQQSLVSAKQLGYHKGIATMIMNIGNVHISTGNLIQAFEQYVRGLEIVEQHIGEETRASAGFLMNIATVFQLMGDYDQALEYYLRSLAICEKLGRQYDMALALWNIGLLYGEHGNSKLAQDYMLRAIANYEQLGLHITKAELLAKLAMITASAGENELALEYAQQSLGIPLPHDHSVQHITAYAYHAIGNVHTACGDDKQALHYLRKAHVLYGETPEIEESITIHIDMGMVLARRRSFAKALKLTHTALEIAERTPESKPALAKVTAQLAEVYELMGNSKKALEYFKVFRDVEKVIFNEKSDYKVQTLTILHQVEEAQKETEIVQLKNKQLQHDMEYLQNDLVVHAMHLAQRTAFLRKVKRDIAAIGKGAVKSAHREVRTTIRNLEKVLAVKNTGSTEKKIGTLQKTKHHLATTGEKALHSALHDIESIVQSLESSLLDATPWQGFEQQFRKVYGEFLNLLASQFPQLSPTELKVCALIRINMSSKEISNILNVAPRSVDTYRYNIRQKMGISPEKSLSEFMAKMIEKT